MRNRWFPARVADYVPFQQLKVLKSQEVDMQRDVSFGVRVNLEEAEEDGGGMRALTSGDWPVASLLAVDEAHCVSTPSSLPQSTSHASASSRRRPSHAMARLVQPTCSRRLP